MSPHEILSKTELKQFSYYQLYFKRKKNRINNIYNFKLALSHFVYYIYGIKPNFAEQ